MLLGQIGLLGFMIFGFLFIMSLIRKDGKVIRHFIISGIFLLVFSVIFISNNSNNKNIEPIPEPIIHEGNGDKNLDIEKVDEGPLILDVEGNENSGIFSIHGYNDHDDLTKYLVGTFYPYKGTLFVPKKRVLDNPETSLLKIESEENDAWKIEARSLRSIKAIESVGEIEGTDDDVLLIKEKFKEAKVTYEESHFDFKIDGYNTKADNSETYFYPLVDTSEDNDPDTFKIDEEINLLVVNAVGPWSIDIK